MKIRIGTREDAIKACKNYHYSRTAPVSKYIFNIFNDYDEWCGVILFGTGASPKIGNQYGLWQGEILELVRVALNGKQECTSQCVAAALKEVHRMNPVVKMIVSFADCDQNHIGTIYQATNWQYVGCVNVNKRAAFVIHGQKMHPKSCYQRGWKQSLPWLKEHIDNDAAEFISRGKHKYIYCFDKKLKKRLKTLSKPYPKQRIEYAASGTKIIL